MKHYQSFMGQLNYGLFLTFLALLPFPQLPLRYAFVAWLITWALEGRWLDSRNLRRDRLIIPFLLFAIWYLWGAVSMLWAADASWASRQLEHYMGIPLILLPALWGVNDYYRWEQCTKTIILSCIAAALIYPFTLYWVYNAQLFHEFESYQKSAAQALPADFFANAISIIKHRLFLCTVEMLGIVCLLTQRKVIMARWGKMKGIMAIVAGIVLMGGLMLATQSRATLFVVLALAVAACIFWTPRRYRPAVGTGSILVAITLCGCIYFFHPRMQEIRAHSMRLEQFDPMRNPRFNIWQAALEHTEDYSLYGLGWGQSTPYLIEAYTQKGYGDYTILAFHTHNQFLAVWMELGIPGLLFFLAAMLSLIVCTHGNTRRQATYLVTFYGLNMLCDKMFGTFDGIAIWCAWLMLILLYDREQTMGEQA